VTKLATGAAVAAFIVGLLVASALPGLQYVRPPGRAVDQKAQDRESRRGPRRVVCMSPAVTEITYALGQGDRVVGVSQYSTYPPDARTKPECGGAPNPNLEVILSLRPDLIITQGKAEQLAVFARDHGINILSVELEDLESVFVAARQIGEALAAAEEAEVLCARMRLGLAEVKLAVRDKARPRVFVVVGREPGTLRNLSTIGPGSFLNDVLELAGGENVFGDLPRPYGAVSKELLLQRQPEVIVELLGEGMIETAEEARIKSIWKGMSGLPAVQNGRIYAVESTYALIPGPRLVDLAKKLASILHGPEGL